MRVINSSEFGAHSNRFFKKQEVHPARCSTQSADFLSKAGKFDKLMDMFWDYKKSAIKKQAKHDEKWMLDRLINFGLGRRKLSRKLLKKYLPELNIDENKRAALELLVWNKKF